MNDREYSSEKPVRRREGAPRAAAVVTGKGSARQNGGASDLGSFSDPELSDLRQELLDASVQTSELERELSDARAEAIHSRSELQKALSEVESRKAAGRKLQDELKRLTEEHQALSRKHTAAANDRDTALDCTQQMADEIEKLRLRAETAESLMEEAQAQVDALRCEEVELTQAVASAQVEISALMARLQEQERELSEERARHIETQSERTTLLRKTDELEQQLKQFRIEMAATRATLATAEQQAAKLEGVEQSLAQTVALHKAAQEVVVRLERELFDSTTQCQELRRSLSENTAGQDLMEARDRLAEATKERDRLTGEVQQLSDDCKLVTAAKSRGDEQIKTLTRELDEARRRAEAASEARLRQDNEVLRGIIARQNSELEQKHTQLIRLRRARFGVRLAYASFVLGLVLVAAWAIKTVPGLQLSGLLKF